MSALVKNERGSALIMAVMAMLIMGVLSISFALLADIESRVGVSYKQQAQAEALAEAGLERARDAVRTAVTTPQGFTNWFNGPTANHVLFSAQDLNGGQYWARIDNDCAVVNTVPSAIEEPSHLPGATPCDNVTDFNQVGVITAWAVSGQGRSRTRAVVGVDNPWRHVCSNAQPDNNGYCNEPGNRNGTPSVSPADPGDPNGPQAYTDLPRPILGCSRIDPEVHRTYGSSTLGVGTNAARCGAWNSMYPYVSPSGYAPPLPGAGGPRLVMMGELPPSQGGTGRTCNDDPGPFAGTHASYFGYFDCALTTPCPAAICGAIRMACVYPTDSRVVALSGYTDTTNYAPRDAGGRCNANTGMVFQGDWLNAPTFGSQAQQYTIYVMGNWSQQNNSQYYGTLVVEGTQAGGIVYQIGNGATTAIWAGPTSGPAVPAGWTFSNQYGYPVVALIYTPYLAPPTITPTYLPQDHYSDFGSSNTQVHGMIYSGGHVNFNPLSVDGTIVAFEIQTQGSATYNYNSWYGINTPPPGFPPGGGNQVVVIRKSFVVCTSYSDDGGGPTACN